MKEVLKSLPYIIIGSVAFIVITAMDLISLLIALLTKVTRLIFMRLLVAFDMYDICDDIDTEKNINNHLVNQAYKYYVDLMYPVKEDIEEDDEDE